MKRAFHWQTGEVCGIIADIKEKGFAEVDIDFEAELENLLLDIEAASEGIFRDDEVPIEFILSDMEDEKDFYARVTLVDGGYIDFYLVDQKEEGYDEIFWG